MQKTTTIAEIGCDRQRDGNIRVYQQQFQGRANVFTVVVIGIAAEVVDGILDVVAYDVVSELVWNESHCCSWTDYQIDPSSDGDIIQVRFGTDDAVVREFVSALSELLSRARHDRLLADRAAS